MTKAIRWQPEQVAAFEAKKAAVKAAQTPAPKPNKYRNKKIETEHGTFDSIKEHEHFKKLEILEAAGYIKNLRRQVPVELVPAVMLDGRKKPAIRIVLDFVYEDHGITIYCDVKSAITKKNATYRLKRHLFKHVTGSDIKEV